MYYVYILQCSDGSYYVGHTNNLHRRVTDHNAGIASRYTRDRTPARLLFSEPLPTRDEAVRRERQIKNWTRAKKEALIRGRSPRAMD